MEQEEEQLNRLRDIIPADPCHELRRSRAGYALFDTELSECERQLAEDDEIDENYKSLLFCLPSKEEGFEPNKKKRKEKDDVNEHDEGGNAEEENDPQYECFLKHLKEHDKSFVLEYEKDCSTVVIKYEGDISDEECDPEPRRKSNRVMKQKIGLSNGMPGVEKQRKHDQQSNSVKKTKSLTRRKLRREVDKVENVEGSPNDIAPDPECLHLHQNVELEDDRHDSMHMGNTVVNEKIYGANQKKEKARELSRAMRQKVGLSNQMPGMENHRKHGPQSTSVKKTKSLTQRKSSNEADKVENVEGSPNDMPPDPEYLHLHQNVKLEDDHMHKGHNVVNDTIYGLNDQKKQDRWMLTRALKQKFGLSNQIPGVENQHKCNLQSTSAKKKGLTWRKSGNEADKVENVKSSPNDMVPDPEYLYLHQNVKLEDDHYVYMHKGHTVVTEKTYKVNEQKKLKQRKLSRAMNQKIRLSDQMPGVENERKHDPLYSSAKKTKNLTQRKSRNETDKVENVKGSPTDMFLVPEYIHLHQNVKREDDQKKQHWRKLSRARKQKVGPSNQMPVVENQQKHDLQPTSVKKTKSLTLRRSREEPEKIEIVKCSSSEFRNVKAAKCFMANKNIDENNLEKEGYDEIVPEVEIIDSAAYLKEGILSPFVPSKILRMEDDFQNIGRSSVRDEFRERVLNVLSKPYDKKEYIKHQEAVRSYLDYYPDLGKKLKRHRYNKGKRLVILRGFFYWLQNVTQEGAFKPWKDRACLAVEPGSS
ncbi:hypothetical protein Pfo_021232 [Paulownia fortunei]|nr:hypothetical protein Pfo_021232 [Paulownia fortunei]